MAIGERIRFLRNLRGMTQKYLGMKIGFTEKTADVRMAQYENGARTPKKKMVADFANELKVSTHALTVPNIDTDIGLMHTLFTLEDLRGLTAGEIDGEICLRLDKSKEWLMWACWRCYLLGRSRPQSSKPEKSLKRNMTSGDIIIRNLTLSSVGQRFPRKS